MTRRVAQVFSACVAYFYGWPKDLSVVSFETRSGISRTHQLNETCLTSRLRRRLRRHADRPALNKLRFDRRLAGVFFSLADVTDPAHDAVRHRTAAPADMRDRWTALAEMRVVIDADQGIDPRRRTGPELTQPGKQSHQNTNHQDKRNFRPCLDPHRYCSYEHTLCHPSTNPAARVPRPSGRSSTTAGTTSSLATSSTTASPSDHYAQAASTPSNLFSAAAT